MKEEVAEVIKREEALLTERTSVEKTHQVVREQAIESEGSARNIARLSKGKVSGWWSFSHTCTWARREAIFKAIVTSFKNSFLETSQPLLSRYTVSP